METKIPNVGEVKSPNVHGFYFVFWVLGFFALTHSEKYIYITTRYTPILLVSVETRVSCDNT